MTIPITNVGDDGEDRGDEKNWMYLRTILEMELTELANGLDVGMI